MIKIKLVIYYFIVKTNNKKNKNTIKILVNVYNLANFTRKKTQLGKNLT
jgi:hypothetical protein